MDLDKALAEHLEAYHTGEAQAVTSRELERTFQVSGPALRKAVNRLRADGVPICSFDGGYYYAETFEELDHTICQLLSRVRNILRAVRGLRKACRKFVDTGQTSIPLGAPIAPGVVIPEKLHPLGGRQGQAAVAHQQAGAEPLRPVRGRVRRQRHRHP